MKRWLYILVVIPFLTSCFQEQEYPAIPEITFLEVSTEADPVIALTSDVYIRFAFQDGDGDLGHKNDDDTMANVFVKDLRTGFVNSLAYSIPPLPVKGSSKTLKGDIAFNFRNSLFCNPLVPGKVTDTIQYDIYVKDQAGNISNTITTSPIIVSCF